MELNQQILKDYCTHLKTIKYKGIVQTIKLMHCTDKDDDIFDNINVNVKECIVLRLIKIRQPERNKGYGNIIMKEIIELANSYNIPIILYVSIKYGSDLKRLYKFYQNHNFVLIKNDPYKKMVYMPKVI
jgi:GNAT superfamily N-acetyltransferase